jgi:hypothetical protein
MTKDELKAFKQMERRFYNAGPRKPFRYMTWPTIDDALLYAFKAGLKRRKLEAK